MTSPNRLVDEATTPAERVIALAASVSPRPLSHDAWDDVMARAVLRRRSMVRSAPAFVVSMLAGILLVVALRPATQAPVPRPVQVVATDTTRWSQVAQGVLSLEAGRLVVTEPGDGVLHVRTPDFTLETQNSRFLADVTTNGTVLVVEAGEVVVRARETSHTVRAGESFTWPPAPQIPAHLLGMTPAAGPCTQREGPARIACLEVEATGASLEAQAALYERGALEAKAGRASQALAAWTESLTRFPGGVLEPEVRIAVVVELVRLRRYREAVEAARTFEAAFPDDARASDVASLRAAIERP